MNVLPACMNLHQCMPVGFPGTGVTDGCHPPRGCWELNKFSARAASALGRCRAISPAPPARLKPVHFPPPRCCCSSPVWSPSNIPPPRLFPPSTDANVLIPRPCLKCFSNSLCLWDQSKCLKNGSSPVSYPSLAPLHSLFSHNKSLLALSICHSLAPVSLHTMFSLPEQLLLCRHLFHPSAVSAFSG